MPNGAEVDAAFDLRRSSEPLHISEPGNQPLGQAVLPTVLSLHFASFGRLIVKVTYCLLCIPMALMMFPGSQMSIMRHRKRQPRLSVFNEHLFDGFATGLLAALGVFVWAKGLLPVTTADRRQVEIIILY